MLFLGKFLVQLLYLELGTRNFKLKVHESICKTFSCTIIFLFNLYIGFAQDDFKMPNLRVNLSEDKSSYAGMLMVNQIWTRYIWNNPDVNGVEQYSDMDLGIRRSSLIFYTSLMDRVFIYTQIGADSITYQSRVANSSV